MPAPTAANLLADVPSKLPEELVQTLAEYPHLRIERIVSTGHASPPGFWYDQPEHEWVLVVQGQAVLEFPAEPPVTLNAGDYLFLPAGKKHRVDWTSPAEPTVWLALFFPATENNADQGSDRNSIRQCCDLAARACRLPHSSHLS